MIGLKIFGVGSLIVKMRNVAKKVPDNARKAMHRGAEHIVDEAKLNAPVLTHAIEDSIRIEKEYGERGRLQIDVVAGGYVDGKDVDAYVALIHENYDKMKMGKLSELKQAAHPEREVGGKFLERARAAEEPKIKAALIEATLEGIREEGL